ncbi:Hypothetical predicted protein, partial [Pelobates cultripes]
DQRSWESHTPQFQPVPPAPPNHPSGQPSQCLRAQPVVTFPQRAHTKRQRPRKCKSRQAINRPTPKQREISPEKIKCTAEGQEEQRESGRLQSLPVTTSTAITLLGWQLHSTLLDFNLPVAGIG